MINKTIKAAIFALVLTGTSTAADAATGHPFEATHERAATFAWLGVKGVPLMKERKCYSQILKKTEGRPSDLINATPKQFEYATEAAIDYLKEGDKPLVLKPIFDKYYAEDYDFKNMVDGMNEKRPDYGAWTCYQFIEALSASVSYLLDVYHGVDINGDRIERGFDGHLWKLRARIEDEAAQAEGYRDAAHREAVLDGDEEKASADESALGSLNGSNPSEETMEEYAARMTDNRMERSRFAVEYLQKKYDVTISYDSGYGMKNWPYFVLAESGEVKGHTFESLLKVECEALKDQLENAMLGQPLGRMVPAVAVKEITKIMKGWKCSIRQ